MTSTLTRSGACGCGAVRFETEGEPARCGLCHCRTCQVAHGAPYLAFAVFSRSAVTLMGEPARWESSAGYIRLYCAQCGSRVANLAGTEIELPMAGFTEPSEWVPAYESWTVRRLPWVLPLAVPQYARDRPA